ncbi:MAG: DUF1003 domain-containing protein [Verrucomicrobiota bacterium]
MSHYPTVAPTEHAECQICHRHFEADEIVLGQSVRPAVVDMIQKDHPNWQEQGFICLPDLNIYRNRYTQQLVEEDVGEITELEKEVIESLNENELLSVNVNDEFAEKLTFGQALSDKIARFGGSWAFILSFGGVLVLWIFINTAILPKEKQFDEYPFILLNLVLSCLAALQAPVIMMSQNRQEAKDRLRSEQDYKINLKAELEIRHMMSKLDQLRQHQWRRLLEIQHIQLDLMSELAQKRSAPKASMGGGEKASPESAN